MMALEWNFCFHGVGVGYFNDDIDPRWVAGGLEEWKFQRRQKITNQNIDYCFGQRFYTAADLINMMGADEDAAKDRGWNIPQMKQAVQMLWDDPQYQYNLEAWVKALKDNDVFYQSDKVQSVQCVRMLVRELDNTYTLLIFTMNPLQEKDGFLYEGFSEFKKLNDALVLFYLQPGIGDLYSVRGYAYQYFESDLALNRFTSILLDNAQNNSGNTLQAKTYEAMDEMAFNRQGNTTVYSPDYEVVPVVLPDYSKSLLPIIQFVQGIGDEAAGSFIGSNGIGAGEGDQRKTAEQLKMESLSSGELSDAERTNFYNSLRFLYNAQWRRIVDDRVSLNTPFGPEIIQFLKDMKEAGVPDRVVHEGISYWQPMRAINRGSPITGMVNSQALVGLSGRFDPEGQNEATRIATAQILGGWQDVDMFIPPVNQPRASQDQTNAVYENILLFGHNAVPVLPGQNDRIHAAVHLQALDQGADAVKESVDGDPIPEAVKSMESYGLAIDHTQAHMQRLSTMNPQPPEVKAFGTILGAAKNAFKQYSAVVRKRVEGEQIQQQKMAQQQQKAQFDAAVQEQAAKQGGQDPANDPGHQAYLAGMDSQTKMMQAQHDMQIRDMQAKARTQSDIQSRLAVAQTDQQIAFAKARNDISLAQAKAGITNQGKRLTTAADLEAKDLKTSQDLRHEEAYAAQERKNANASE